MAFRYIVARREKSRSADDTGTSCNSMQQKEARCDIAQSRIYLVVWHVSKCCAPPARGTLQDGVTRIRRSGLHPVKYRLRVFVSRATNAAGVDDESTISQPHDTRNVRVSAKDQRFRYPSGLRFDILDGARMNDG